MQGALGHICYNRPMSQISRQYMGQSAKDLLSILEDSLDPSTFGLLKAVAGKASEIEMPLFLVGGPVRDMLLGMPVKDLDVVVEGNAPVLAFEVAKELSGDVTSYSQFGTATMRVEGQRFDLATARQETYLRPGALPTVNPSAIHEDLGRRDFSVNAMALALSGPQPGRIMDPYNGRGDLGLGLIRILHPKSFVDDATRVFRAVRYEQRLNFKLEEDTHRLLLEAIEDEMMGTISWDRIRRELELIFHEHQPHLALSRCGELGILQAVYPPLGDGAGASLVAGAGCGSGQAPLVYLAALSYGLGAEQGEAFIHRLNMPSRWAGVVRDTIALRQELPLLGDMSSGQLCSALDRFDPISVEAVALLSDSLPVREALERYLKVLRYIKPSLNGRDIISLGVAQGPMVGEILRKLRAARADGRVATREEEIQAVKNHISHISRDRRLP